MEGNAAQCRPNLRIERGTMKNGARTALNKYRSYRAAKRKYYFHIRASCPSPLASSEWTMRDDPITAPSSHLPTPSPLSPLREIRSRISAHPCFRPSPRRSVFPFFIRSTNRNPPPLSPPPTTGYGKFIASSVSNKRHGH